MVMVVAARDGEGREAVDGRTKRGTGRSRRLVGDAVVRRCGVRDCTFVPKSSLRVSNT